MKGAIMQLILSTPYEQFELVSNKMKSIMSYGKSKNTKKPIYWKISENNGIKRIQAYQLGGAKISMTLVPFENMYELADFSHDGRFQQSVDLLNTIVEHKGIYQFIA